MAIKRAQNFYRTATVSAAVTLLAVWLLPALAFADSYVSVSTGNSSSESVINNSESNSSSRTYISATANGQNRTVIINGDGTSTDNSVFVRLRSQNGIATSTIRIKTPAGNYYQLIPNRTRNSTTTIQIKPDRPIFASSTAPGLNTTSQVYLPCAPESGSVFYRLFPFLFGRHCPMAASTSAVSAGVPANTGWTGKLFGWFNW
ncbi:MAG: hypothetical protein P4L74_07445 [Candidatus Doudnabacteria bacterium]|nr:hypothetical protein [Candidatus Doudnabacteria bacterium]